MQVQTFILDMGKLITLTERKTEYLAFEGTKRLLGINPLAGGIESRSGQIWRQFDGIINFSWHRICIYTKKTTALFAVAAGEQSEENESVLCLSKDPERGKHFYFSSAKVLLLFDICKYNKRKIYF